MNWWLSLSLSLFVFQLFSFPLAGSGGLLLLLAVVGDHDRRSGVREVRAKQVNQTFKEIRPWPSSWRDDSLR